jgi:hypothetical protein
MTVSCFKAIVPIPTPVYTHVLCECQLLCNSQFLVCAGKGPAQCEPLCLDLRQLVLSKLSVRDLACAACACREFQAAYLRRVAEERATLIAVAKETYRHGMFRAIVAAFQQTSSELDIANFFKPGILMINAAGGLEHFTGEEANRAWYAGGPQTEVWKASPARNMGYGTPSLHASVVVDLPGRGSFTSVQLSLYRHRETGPELKVMMSREAPTAAMGLLLGICAETPETPSLHFQRPVAVEVSIAGMPSSLAGIREVEDVVGPLGLLAESFVIHPIFSTANPLGQRVQARSRGDLKSVRVYI